MFLQRSHCCILGLFLSFLLVSVMMTIALCLRLIVFANNYHADMPTDMRAFAHVSRSIFCSNYTISAALKNDPPQGVIPNTLPEFDAYVSDTNPYDHVIRNETSKVSLVGAQGLRPGQKFVHAFHMLEGSSMVIKICNHKEPDTEALADSASKAGLWLYVVKGYKESTALQDYIDKYGVSNTTAASLCDQFMCEDWFYVNADDSCHALGLNHYFTTNNIEFNVSRTYNMIYVYPNYHTSDRMKDLRYAQKVYLNYTMHRTRFDLSNALHYTKRISTTKLPARKHVILDFRYFINDTSNPLEFITTTFQCDPNMMTYMGIFLFIGVISLVIIAVLTIRRVMRDDGYEELRGFENSAQSYASVESMNT